MNRSRAGLARSGQPEIVEFGRPKSSTLVFQFKGDFNRLLSSDVEQLKVLTELDLADNTIAALPDELQHLENLQQLTLRQNRLETLPEWFFQRFSGLNLLNLGYNKLRQIPSFIRNFKHIRYLYVDHNSLSKFPTEVCQLTSLLVLDLSSNSIVTLPDDLQNLSNLEELYLQNNDIQKISESVCALRKLKILNVSNNDLSEVTMKLYKLGNLDALQITGNTNLVEPPDNVTNKSTPVIMAYLKAKDENKDLAPTEFFRQNSELLLKSPRQRTSMIITPSAINKSFSKATAAHVRSRSRTIGMEDSGSPAPSPRLDTGSIRSGTRSLSKAISQLVEKFDSEKETMTGSKSSEQLSHSRSSSLVTAPGVFKPTRPSLPPQFLDGKHVGVNSITGESKKLRTSGSVSVRPATDSGDNKGSGHHTPQLHAGDSSSSEEPVREMAPPKPRAAHPDDDLSFSASDRESGIELPDPDREKIPQYEGEIRWMPKGDPQYLMVKANENFTVETGQELNFFDTFAPQNLEVLEADNYEDYKKYFCEKEHLNYVGSHIDKGPVFISIISKATDHGYRTLVRTKDGDFRIHFPKSANIATEAGLKKVLKKNQDLPWLAQAKVRLIPDENFSRDFLDLEQKLVVHAFKMGIVYCKDGQTEEAEMLSNDSASPDFEEFLNFLGETIELKDWDRYAGGLDTKKNTTGIQSVYTEYSGSEIMFHVSTLLPSSGGSDDPERIQSKKIHIGNDIVVLFFIDGNSSISLDSIVSQFNHVYIIISKVPDKYRKMYRMTVASKKGVGQTSPAIPGGSIFEKTPELRKLLLTKIINCERSAYRSMGFEGPLQRMRLHLLRDLAKMYAPKIMKEIDKKRRDRLHKRKLDSRLTLSTTLYNNKSSRLEFSGSRSSALNTGKSDVTGSPALNESGSLDGSKTYPADATDATDAVAVDVVKPKSRRKLSGGQCMKPMYSTTNVKEEAPKKKRRGSKSSTKSHASDKENITKDTGNADVTILNEKIDEVEETNSRMESTNNSWPETPVKKSTFGFDSDPYNINSPRPESLDAMNKNSIQVAAESADSSENNNDNNNKTDNNDATDIEIDGGHRTKIEFEVIPEKGNSPERPTLPNKEGDENSSSSSSNDETKEPNGHSIESAAQTPEDPPKTEGDKNAKRKEKRKIWEEKNKRRMEVSNKKVLRFLKSLRPKKKKKLVAEPEMDPGAAEKAT